MRASELRYEDRDDRMIRNSIENELRLLIYLSFEGLPNQRIDDGCVCKAQMEFTSGYEVRSEHEYYVTIQQKPYIVDSQRGIQMGVILDGEEAGNEVQDLGNELREMGDRWEVRR